MGIRVGFYFGGPDGLLSCFLNSPLDQFRDFLVEVLAEFPEDVGPASLQLVEEVRLSGVHALEKATELNHRLVDTLIIDWFLFLDVGHKCQLSRASDSWGNVRYYRELRKQLVHRGVNIADDLLSYIFSGRPLLRDGTLYPFYSEDEVTKIGYWTAEEARHLKDELDRSSQAPWMAEIREGGVLGIVEQVVIEAVLRDTGVVFLVC